MTDPTTTTAATVVATTTTTTTTSSQPVATATAINTSTSSSALPAVPVQNQPPPPAASADQVDDDTLQCEWQGCNRRFPTPDDLYRHLTDDHVGRKVTNNLTLNCHWNNCKVTTVKRDHITSHVRVHVPYKPHRCRNCGKRFKRPQDLKKHIKTHADDSVLSRVSDPTGGPRMRGPGSYHGRSGGLVNDLQSLAATATGFYDHPMQPGPGGHQGFAQHTHSANPTYYGGGHHPYGPSDMFSSSGQAGGGPSHQAASVDARKRGYDALNDFFGAVKRREINPASYGEVADSLMALHGVDLPVLGSTHVFQSNAPMVHTGGHEGSIGRQQPTMPAFTNLRTKNDLISVESFLDQIQSTTYDSGNRVAVTGVSHPGIQSIGRTGLQSGHAEAPAETNMANLTAPTIPASSHSTQSGTPALTPASSASQPSGYSPASIGSESHGTSPVPASSATSMYPSLPLTNSRGGTPSGYPGPSRTPVSTLGPAFSGDQPPRYSGQMHHRAARPVDDANIDPALTSLPHPSQQPRVGSATAIGSSPEVLRVVKSIQGFVKMKLREHDYEEDADVNMEDVIESVEEGEGTAPSSDHFNPPVNLYPILRAVEGAH